MDIREMSVGKRIEYRIIGIATGLIIILATWISTYVWKIGEWATIFYIAGAVLVLFGAVASLAEYHLSSSLEDILQE